MYSSRHDRKAAGREKKHKEALEALKRMYPSGACMPRRPAACVCPGALQPLRCCVAEREVRP